MLVHVTFKIDNETLYKLDATAERLGITRSEAIRRAIALWLKYNYKIEPKRIRLES